MPEGYVERVCDRRVLSERRGSPQIHRYVADSQSAGFSLCFFSLFIFLGIIEALSQPFTFELPYHIFTTSLRGIWRIPTNEDDSPIAAKQRKAAVIAWQHDGVKNEKEHGRVK